MMEDRFRVRGWSVYDNGYYNDIQNMLFGEEDEMTLLDAISKGLVNEIIPEQCTGLKDKYGNLIYEGDIIRGVWKDVKIEYVVKYNKCNAQFILEIPNEDSLGEFDLLESDHLEIIGNIHKNFELLEVE